MSDSSNNLHIPPSKHDPYAALRLRNFQLFLLGLVLAILGEQMLGVALGWELYQRTKSTFALGLVGLVQVLPVVLLSLPAGQLADRRDRKLITLLTLGALGVCAAGLALLSALDGPLLLIYTCLFGVGVARAFHGPAATALLTQLIPPDTFGNAATWESGIWQVAAITGPALGGWGVALWSPALVYCATAALMLLGLVLIAGTRPRRLERAAAEAVSWGEMLVGLRWVFATKEILASITLDMFAVLLGGATALLPVFAEDILHVGATGLGWLRAAPSVGALLVALVIAHRPPFKRAGRTLLIVVAGFGLATIVFGLSNWFWLSLLMLALLGALDNISVVIRSTLLLLRTPDAMRGRVNAVHSVFVGISNELGAFESGTVAALLGPVGAVVAGGIGTLAVVAWVALRWPVMLRLGQIQPEPSFIEVAERAEPLLP